MCDSIYLIQYTDSVLHKQIRNHYIKSEKYSLDLILN